MTASRIALILFLGALPLSVACAAGGVPTLDTQRMCRETANAGLGTLYDTNRCIQSEKEARDKLVKEWSSFNAGDRKLCTDTATMGGSASYVQLITCLELERDVKTSRDVKLDTKR